MFAKSYKQCASVYLNSSLYSLSLISFSPLLKVIVSFQLLLVVREESGDPCLALTSIVIKFRGLLLCESS